MHVVTRGLKHDERTGTNWPLVYQLSCQGHCWVAKSGIDKRWKHISVKLTPRWELVDSPQITGLIGSRCKRRKAFSRGVLINHFILRYTQNFWVYYTQCILSVSNNRYRFYLFCKIKNNLNVKVAIILELPHLIPFRTQKWNTPRPMVVLRRESR